MKLSIIVPSLNEGAVIESLLQNLQALREQGHEVLLSDGGSTDNTVLRAKAYVDHTVQGEAGRAAQMNRAAALAQGDLLWFIHADTGCVTPVTEIATAINRSKAKWGFCRVHLNAQAMIYRVIERLMNWRSCLSHIATGDQAIFVQRELFLQVGGYADMPLMEDIALSKTLRKKYPPICLRQKVLTSARRWQRQGVLRTILLMWRLRIAYFLGISPQRLAKHYRLCSSPSRAS